MSEAFSVRDLRREQGLTQAEFAALLGITSPGHMSEIERSGQCAVKVALAIESLSAGRIDAASLNDEVRMARAGHAPIDTPLSQNASPGNADEVSAEVTR